MSLIKHHGPSFFFIVVAIAHMQKWIQIDTYAIILFILATLPYLTPLISDHIESLKYGDFELKMDRKGKSAEEIHAAESKKKKMISEPPSNFPYSLASFLVISTLWHYQQQYFENNPSRRWGFTIGPDNFEYFRFANAVTELTNKGLVYRDARDLVYLTDAGLKFAEDFKDVLEKNGPFYGNFTPA